LWCAEGTIISKSALQTPATTGRRSLLALSLVFDEWQKIDDPLDVFPVRFRRVFIDPQIHQQLRVVLRNIVGVITLLDSIADAVNTKNEAVYIFGDI